MTAVYAHRGDTRRSPENTLAAFADALAHGADGVELDVRRTVDGVVVVHHDPDVPGCGPVAWSRAADLPAGIPTLVEALEVCAGAKVNVEIKSGPGDPGDDETCQIAVDVARLVAGPARAGRVVVSSFDAATLDAVVREDHQVPVGWLRGVVDPLAGAVEEAAGRGYGAVHPFVSQVDRAGVEAAHRMGLSVAVWTVNARADLEAMVAMGADAVVTDQLDMALEVVRARGAGTDPRGAPAAVRPAGPAPGGKP